MKYETAIYLFIGLFILTFLVDYYLILKRLLKDDPKKDKNKKGKLKKKKRIDEIDYLVIRFQLDIKKLTKNRVIFWIAIINSFIISITSSIVLLIPFGILWQLLIAFFILFGLIYSLYEIYGRHLKKMEEQNGNN